MKKLCLLIIILLLSFPIFAQEKISKIDFEDAAVVDVIKAIAKQADLDLVISGDNIMAQNKRVTIHLRDISAEAAIDQVLSASGLTFEKKGGAILVSMLPSNAEGNEVESIRLKHLPAEKACALLAKTMPAIKTGSGGSSNILVLRGRLFQIEDAKKLIEDIDRPVPQILIESKVLEISESDATRLGISFGREAGTFKFVTSKDTGKTVPAEDLLSTLYALAGEGKANIVANPRIATLDDHEAMINIGSRIPYAVPVSSGSNSTQWTVEYIDAGVKLRITPCLNEGGYITTFIQPEVSSVSEWRTTAAGEFPVITTRNAQATLRVKDGETIVVGGLLSETDRENMSRLPILGHIPILGTFFQNRTVEKAKTEIVFLITPYVI